MQGCFGYFRILETYTYVFSCNILARLDAVYSMYNGLLNKQHKCFLLLIRLVLHNGPASTENRTLILSGFFGFNALKVLTVTLASLFLSNGENFS